MIKIAEQLVTQTQLEIIMTSWNTCAEVPTKNKKVFVAFPWKEHAEITRTTFKSDYNKPLFKIEFFSH